MEIQKFFNINVEELKKCLNQTKLDSKSWLTNTIVTVSSDMKYFAFCYKNTFSIYRIDKPDILPMQHFLQQDSETITSCLWFSPPFEMQFLLLGSNMGRVYIVSASGHLVDTKHFQQAPIVKIKQNLDDILVIYSGLLIKLDYKPFCQHLTCLVNKEIDSDPFIEKRWAINSQDKIHDVIWTRSSKSSLLDIYNGVSNDSIIAVGQKPCLCTYTSKNGSGNVTSASRLASKVGNAVFSMAKSWFFGGAPKEEESPKKTVQAPTQGVPTIQFHDHPREIKAIIMDPLGNYAATSDSLGRVLILDLNYQLIIRIFKGYRDAQCTWIVKDNKSFLAIYLPRKGLLEIWNPINGRRDTCLNVGGNCVFFQASTFGHAQRDEIKNGDSILMTSDGVVYKMVNEIDIYDPNDQILLEEFARVIGNKSEMEKILKKFKSSKYAVLAVESLQGVDSSMLKMICELGSFLCKDERYQRWFQNRMNVVEAFEICEKFVKSQTYQSKQWAFIFGKEIFDWVEFPTKFEARDGLTLDKLLSNIDFYGEKIRVSHQKIQNLIILFDSLFVDFETFEKVEFLFNLDQSHLQDVFFVWFLTTPIKSLMQIDPKLVQKVILSLTDSKKRILTKLTKNAKQSVNSANVLLLLKFFDEHDEELDKSKQIYFIQSNLTVPLAFKLTLDNVEKEIPIYKLIAFQQMTENTENCKKLIDRFECEEANDAIHYFSAIQCYENHNFELTLDHLSQITSCNQMAICHSLLYHLFESKQIQDVLDNNLTSVTELFQNQIKFFIKIFKYLYQKVQVGSKIFYAEYLYDLRKKCLETSLSHEILDEILSLLAFVDIVSSCKTLPQFDAHKLFSKQVLTYFMSCKDDSVSNTSRKDFLIKMMQDHINQAVELCDVFCIPRDFVLMIELKRMYVELRDVDAEKVLDEIKDKNQAGNEMIEIARGRVGLILHFIGKNKKYIHYLSHIPTQLFQWMGQSVVESEKIEIVDAKYLDATCKMLIKCQECIAVKKDSLEVNKVSQMLQFVENVKFE